MQKTINKICDWVVIIVGCIALVVSLFGASDDFLIWPIAISSGIVLYYLVRVVVLFFFRRPLFDWHLINGHFLRKVCCLILLMPFALTGIAMIFMESSKELVWQEQLYECGDKELPCAITHKQQSPNLFWSTYYHFIDPGNQHMTTSQTGRGWSALIAILGVFLLNGLLVSSIIGWIDIRKEKWLKGEVKYRGFLRKHKHHIIIGGNDMVFGVVRQILSAKNRSNVPYILIQTTRDVEGFRRELFSTLTEEQQQRVIIYYGNRTSEKDIAALGLGAAKEVYIIGEDVRADDIESYHDTMNMKCLELLRKLYEQTPNGKEITAQIEAVNNYKKELGEPNSDEAALRSDANNQKLEEKWKNRPRLNCRVMFEYQTSFSVFQFFDINEQMDAYIKFTPFNYYELWAQNVLINKCVDPKEIESNFQNGKYLPLEGADGIKADEAKYVHLFIVGMSRMGVAMAIEAAHLSHYPNFEEKRIRTKITFIDKKASEERDFFMGRFKELFSISHWRYGDACVSEGIDWQRQHTPSGYEHLGGDFLDIEWEFINGGVENANIQDYILSSAKPEAKITIAICLPESNRSHAAALFLNKKIYESKSVLQVFSYNRYGDSIINAISKSSSEYPFCGKLRSFGSAEDCVVCRHLELSETIGGFIDNAYNGGKPQYTINAESSYSGKSNTANQWSSIYNGNTLWTKLRCVDFDAKSCTLDQKSIDILADLEHNRWNVEELLMNMRYLEEGEQIDIKCGRRTKKEFKKEMAHLDICSNSKLKEVDPNARQYDVKLTKCLAGIYADLAKTSRE